MRLLKKDNRGGYTLTEYSNEVAPPKYAILSHTWGKEEVVFEDVQNGSYENKLGFAKIQFCAEQAQQNGLEYFWVDTCCINKADFPELLESINSMFRWYQDAERCFVYLSDVSSNKRSCDGVSRTWEASFRSSRWFTRGWTLQELLAPTSVEFFSRERQLLGSKASLVSMIQEITDIPRGALCGTPLSEFGVQERMTWAVRRNTTRLEDKAYCLLGIFDVFVPFIYGERNHAMDRLKKAIADRYGNHLGDTEPLSVNQNASTSRSTGPQTNLPTLGKFQSRDRAEELRNFLGFEQMDSRRATIKEAYRTTCLWLLKTQAYMDWIDLQKFGQHCGFLWIKGKPGAGKSTLVKFAHTRASQSPRNEEIIVSYFFNARGDLLEKSTLGMYRSLLSQILQKAEDLQQVFDEVDLRAPRFEWTVERLRELLTSTVQALGSRRLKCFIDALDECDQDEIRDMVTHFEELGEDSQDRFSVCFASRHYPAIFIRNSIQLVLEDESGHSEDLTKYIRNHLQIEKGKILDHVKEEILQKANGVFMWAVLVIEILNEVYRRGRIHDVQKKLREIPAKLSDLFKQILHRDGRDRDDLLLCIQWVLFAKRPLQLREWYFAVLLGSDQTLDDPVDRDPEYVHAPAEWDPECVSENDMKRFLLDCSKGLAEITKSGKSSRAGNTSRDGKGSTVQFIHESVRDFLIKDGGLYDLWPELKADPETCSHLRLRKCCQRYLAVDLKKYVPSVGELPKPSTKHGLKLLDTLNGRFPFLTYAAENVLYHANAATKGIAGDDFLTSFDLKTWIGVSNVTAKHDNVRHTERVPLVYLLAEYNLPHLIGKCLQAHGVIESTPQERYQHPLLAALAKKHWEAVQAILESNHDSRLENAMAALKTQQDLAVKREVSPLHWALRKNNITFAEILAASPWTDINIEDRHKRTPLSIAAEGGHEVLVQHLLSRNPTPLSKHNALCYASAGRCDRIVLLLLDAGADVNAQGGYYGNALQAASSNGHLDIVKLLLDAGADVDARRGEYGNALQAASSNGHLDIVKLLLDAGADVDARRGEYGNSLQAASSNGHPDIVKLLLDADADVNAQGGWYGNALQAATTTPYPETTANVEVVRLLLKAGADVNRQANLNGTVGAGTYRNALHAASSRGLLEIAELLRSAGAKDP